VFLPGVFDEVGELLNAADLFILPSHEEGMSMALLEAMAAGLPCIASDIPGNQRLIRHDEHGFLVPPACPQALAAAILELVAQPDRCRRYAVAARQRVADEFSVERSVQQHLALFNDLRRARFCKNSPADAGEH
jgi:glycosyltransferase involved in cell wall biosynthesis